MFPRSETRQKVGKAHRDCGAAENRRGTDGRIAQRQVLYAGEIN